MAASMSGAATEVSELCPLRANNFLHSSECTYLPTNGISETLPGNRQVAPLVASKLMLPGNTLVHLLEGADAVSWLSRLRRYDPHNLIRTLRPHSVRLDELHHLPRPALRLSHVRAVVSRRGEKARKRRLLETWELTIGKFGPRNCGSLPVARGRK